MPINLETINSLFNKNFNPKEASLFLNKITKKYKKQSYKNFEEKAKSQIGEKLYAAFIKNYTKNSGTATPNYYQEVFLTDYLYV